MPVKAATKLVITTLESTMRKFFFNKRCVKTKHLSIFLPARDAYCENPSTYCRELIIQSGLIGVKLCPPPLCYHVHCWGEQLELILINYSTPTVGYLCLKSVALIKSVLLH